MLPEGDFPPLVQERALYYAWSHGEPTVAETETVRAEVERLHSDVRAKGGGVPPLPSRHLMHAELLALREYLQGQLAHSEATGLRESMYGMDASGRLSITPEDVRDAEFSTVRLQPGYDEEDVDAFLDTVEQRLRAGQLPLPPGEIDFNVTRFRVGYKIEEVDRFIDRLRDMSR